MQEGVGLPGRVVIDSNRTRKRFDSQGDVCPCVGRPISYPNKSLLILLANATSPLALHLGHAFPYRPRQL
jgi:hypothetical protein